MTTHYKLTSQLGALLDVDGTLLALYVTRPGQTKPEAVIEDSHDDLRHLVNVLDDLISIRRTGRERNALASSALDSIEAGTAPEEASFIQGIPPFSNREPQSFTYPARPREDWPNTSYHYPPS